MASANDLASYPGGDLVAAGIADLTNQRESIPALLVSIGATRLREGGLLVPSPCDDPEHRLYQALARENPDAAHGRYNALVRRLVSFERALERARSSTGTGSTHSEAPSTQHVDLPIRR